MPTAAASGDLHIIAVRAMARPSGADADRPDRHTAAEALRRGGDQVGRAIPARAAARMNEQARPHMDELLGPIAPWQRPGEVLRRVVMGKIAVGPALGLGRGGARREPDKQRGGGSEKSRHGIPWYFLRSPSPSPAVCAFAAHAATRASVRRGQIEPNAIFGYISAIEVSAGYLSLRSGFAQRPS